jgi:SUN family beta-glucosidase
VAATPKPAVAPPQAPAPHIRVADMAHGLTTAQEAYSKLHEDFPDGSIPCSQFPAEYAVPVPWQNLGGWASVQAYDHQDVNSRLVGLANQVNSNCISGSYCSYHCPHGFIKAQWPEAHQGVNGESVGGLECRDNLLYLSRAHASRKLCEDPMSSVPAFIQNNLDEVVSICGTNYPGEEIGLYS